MILDDLIGKTITRIKGDNKYLEIFFDDLQIIIIAEDDKIDISTIKKEEVKELKEFSYNLFTGEKSET